MGKLKSTFPSDNPEAVRFRGGHKIITWAALQALPDWQKEIWAPESMRLAEEYSLYGDTYYENPAELGPYVELPDGKAPVCQIGVLRRKVHLDQARDLWESPFYDRCEEVLVYYLKQIARSLAEGAIRDAARFAGAAVHYIEDCGVPAHAADNGDMEFVKDYLPPPAGFEAFPIHAYTEKSCDFFLLDNRRPRLYGLSTEEAGSNFIERYVEMILFARGLLFPLVRSAYEGDEEKGQALRTQAAKMCAEVTADYLYTATCIGTGRFDADERKALAAVPLAPRWPYRMTAWAPAPYSEPGPRSLSGINLDMDRNPVACELRTTDDSGEPVIFTDSLGAGAPFFYHYRLPPGVYDVFAALVGIHARLGANRALEVRVLADGETLFADTAAPGGVARPIEVKIGGARDLVLVTDGPKWNDPDAIGNHVVWARPELRKAHVP